MGSKSQCIESAEDVGSWRQYDWKPNLFAYPSNDFLWGVHCANVWCFPRIFGTCIFQIFISDMLRCFIHLHIYRILRKRIRPITISECCSQPEARILSLVLTYGLWLIYRSFPFARKGLYHDTRASWDTYTKLVRCDTSLRSIEATYQSHPYPSKHRTDSGTHTNPSQWSAIKPPPPTN